MTKAIAVFLNGSGTSEIANLSLIAAKRTKTRVKPNPAPIVNATDSARLNESEPCKRTKPKTMQLVVIKGINT